MHSAFNDALADTDNTIH